MRYIYRILILHCFSISLKDAYPMSMKLNKTVFNILTRLNLGLPRCHGLVSGFRYCSIPISSMIWSNVSTGSQISKISAIYTGNLPCFGLYCKWFCFMQEHYTTKSASHPLIFKGHRHFLLHVIRGCCFFHSPFFLIFCSFPDWILYFIRRRTTICNSFDDSAGVNIDE